MNNTKQNVVCVLLVKLTYTLYALIFRHKRLTLTQENLTTFTVINLPYVPTLRYKYYT